MQLLLAAFDQAHPGPKGNYWAWCHPSLEVRLLDEFYFRVAAPHRTKLPKNLPATAIIGGGVALDATWCCWYRFLDGGYDLQQRPGRVVILCAFAKRTESLGADLAGVLRSPVFEEVARTAPRQCPLQPPQSLAVSFEANRPASNPTEMAKLLSGEKLLKDGNGALTEVGALLAQVPLDRTWTCEVDGGGEMLRVSAKSSEIVTPAKVAQLVSSIDAASNPEDMRSSRSGFELDGVAKKRFSKPFRRYAVGFVVGLLLGAILGFWAGQYFASKGKSLNIRSLLFWKRK